MINVFFDGVGSVTVSLPRSFLYRALVCNLGFIWVSNLFAIRVGHIPKSTIYFVNTKLLTYNSSSIKSYPIHENPFKETIFRVLPSIF